MARGLKSGDSVKVRKLIEFSKTSPERKNGLEKLEPGTLGKVVGAAQGRSVVVEFGDKRTVLSSQSLEQVKRGPGRSRRKNGAETGDKAASAQKPSAQTSYHYNSPHFMKTFANKLLLKGGLTADPKMVVEISLAELPTEVQKEIRALMQAKLDLDQAATPQAKPRGPGRPPKQPKPEN
jgi:hypothetical protein